MRPDEKREAKPSHARGPHGVDGHDEVETRQNRREAINKDTENRWSHRGVRIYAAQRRVECPTRVQAAGAERIENERAPDEVDVPAQEIELGKSQIFRTNHERNQKIAKHGRNRWNQKEKNHGYAMHGEEFVVGFGRDQGAGGSEQVNPDQGGKEAANEEKERDRGEVEQRNALVVRGQQPRADAIRGIEVMLVGLLGNRQNKTFTHDLLLSRGRRDTGALRGNRLRLQ